MDLGQKLWHPRFMMHTTEEATGVTYGALLGFTLAIIATLAITGGAGFYLARSVSDSDPASVTVTTSTLPPTIFNPHGTPTDNTVQQAATNPFTH
jgi:hypothetical protein